MPAGNRRCDLNFRWQSVYERRGILGKPPVLGRIRTGFQEDWWTHAGACLHADVTIPGLVGRLGHGLPPPDLADLIESFGIWDDLWCDGNRLAIYRPVDGRIMMWFEELAPLLGHGASAPAGWKRFGLHVGGGLVRGTWPVTLGVVRAVGIILRPGAVRRVLGVPASAVLGMRVSVPSLLGPVGERLLERLSEAADSETCLDLLFAHVRAQALTPRADTRRVCGLADQLASSVRITMAEIAKDAGISKRTMERLFHEHVGQTPKHLADIERVRALMQRIQSPRPTDWAACAHDFGFADQAHLIRTFTSAVGISPERYRRIFQAAGLCFGSYVYLQAPHADSASDRLNASA
jgi:AraC-like DNA-binding protein